MKQRRAKARVNGYHVLTFSLKNAINTCSLKETLPLETVFLEPIFGSGNAVFNKNKDLSRRMVRSNGSFGTAQEVKPMAQPFKKICGDVLASTNAVCSDKGEWTEAHAAWLRRGDNAALARRFMDEQMSLAEKNRFQLPPEVMLAALRRANKEEKWGIAEADFVRLASTVPVLPQGRLAS